VVDVRSILLGKQVLVNPESPGLCENDGAVLVLSQTLLIDATAQIVSLPAHNLRDGRAKLDVRVCAFRAAFENQAVLNVLTDVSTKPATPPILAPGATVFHPSGLRNLHGPRLKLVAVLMAVRFQLCCFLLQDTA
jgi:hypothetical protein